MRSMTRWTVGMAAALTLMGGYATGAPLSAGAKRTIENALGCASLGKFDAAEAELTRNGWDHDKGITPVQLAAPLKVFGLSTTKIAVARDGGEQVYRSHFAGTDLPQVVKAASLKLGKDKQSYGRATKLGMLTAEVENGETILTCTVVTE